MKNRRSDVRWTSFRTEKLVLFVLAKTDGLPLFIVTCEQCTIDAEALNGLTEISEYATCVGDHISSLSETVL